MWLLIADLSYFQLFISDYVLIITEYAKTQTAKKFEKFYLSETHILYFQMQNILKM